MTAGPSASGRHGAGFVSAQARPPTASPDAGASSRPGPSCPRKKRPPAAFIAERGQRPASAPPGTGQADLVRGANAAGGSRLKPAPAGRSEDPRPLRLTLSLLRLQRAARRLGCSQRGFLRGLSLLSRPTAQKKDAFRNMAAHGQGSWSSKSSDGLDEVNVILTPANTAPALQPWIEE